jgi:preprotein translocase subunit SecA
VTLATNIAGRGTDIVLGKGVKELGGLVVIGSERHESRRIDNQLRGRGGRQGDPGVTQFYVSTEDDLMRIFQGERVANLMDRLGVDENMPIQNKAVSKTLEAAQKRVEGYNYDTRKNVVQYDNVINRHRRVVYLIRRHILEGENIKPEIDKLIDAALKELTIVPAKNNPKFNEEFEIIFPAKDKDISDIGIIKNDKKRLEAARSLVDKLYQKQEKTLTPDIVREVEREVYLQVLDTLWMQHLENMQHLREGIHWRSVGQRDPLVEYRAESQKLFDGLQKTLREEVLKAIMHVTKADVAHKQTHDTELTRAAQGAVESGVNEISIGEHDVDFTIQKKIVVKKKTERKKKKQKRQNKKRSRK